MKTINVNQGASVEKFPLREWLRLADLKDQPWYSHIRAYNRPIAFLGLEFQTCRVHP